MTNFWKIVMMLGIIFVLTYDAKSGRIERFIEQPVAGQHPPGRDCDSGRFQSLQFAQPQPCEQPGSKTNLGVIYSKNA